MFFFCIVFAKPLSASVFFCIVFAKPLSASVYICLVVTCWERADLFALVCDVQL